MTQEELKQYVTYDPETGIFTWKKSRGKLKANSICGYINKSLGYWDLRINNKRQYGHRLAFLYMHGYIPNFVDHIDGNRSNNKWSNLREANKQQNSANVKLQKNNTTGFKGVFKDKRELKKRYRAYIKVNYKRIHLGLYSTPDEAARAYDEAAMRYFGEFAELNFKNVQKK